MTSTTPHCRKICQYYIFVFYYHQGQGRGQGQGQGRSPQETTKLSFNIVNDYLKNKKLNVLYLSWHICDNSINRVNLSQPNI